jgi:uncharacterized membrane protein
MSRIRNILAIIRGQFWLLPLLISLAALGLAYLLLEHGKSMMPGDAGELWWVYSGDAGSARELLSSQLSGLITMTSLVISITVVILTLAANQLGPRLITLFLTDRQIQGVLGLFLGTILYVLVVMRTIEGELGKEGVPHLAVSGGSALTIACLFTLLFYLHKITRAVVADNVVRSVAEELHSHICGILPDPLGDRHEESDVRFPADATSLSIGEAGYIQVIDYGALLDAACRSAATLEVRVRAGHFLLKEGDHVRVHPPGPIDEKAAAAIRNAFTIGRERTPAQDLEHGIRQLTEIGLRALSPSINDPFTAVAVVHRLGAAIEEVLGREMKAEVMRDDAGVVRLIVSRSDCTTIFGTAFDPLRNAASAHPLVMIRIADVLGQLGPSLSRQRMQNAALSQLARLEETARGAAIADSDRADVLERIGSARRSLGAGPD